MITLTRAHISESSHKKLVNKARLSNNDQLTISYNNMQTIKQQAEYLVNHLFATNTQHRLLSHSTNSELIELITTNQLDNSQIHVLTADSQSCGRGQHGRSWQSPLGNVYLSLYYPVNHQQFPLTSPISGLLSLCIGYHLAELSIIKKINANRVKENQPIIGVKWANDIGFYQQYYSSDIFKPSVFRAATILKADVPQQLLFKPVLSKSDKKIVFNKLLGTLIEPINKNGALIGMVIGVGLNVCSAPKLTNQTMSLSKLSTSKTIPNKQMYQKYQSICLQDLLTSLNKTANVDDKINTELLTPSQLYQPISNAIIQAVLLHDTINKSSKANKIEDDNINSNINSQYLLDRFLQDFSTVDIVRNRYIHHQSMNRHVDKQLPHTLSNETNLHQKSKVVGIDIDGCLQIITDDNKLCRLFTGGIEVVE